MMFSTISKFFATFCAIGLVSFLLISSVKKTHEVSPSSPIPPLLSVIKMDQGKFPAMVRLTSASGLFFCSGTVISDTMVLTAAHCLEDNAIEVQSLADANGQIISVPAMPIMHNRRADYGIVTGDFTLFTKMGIQTDPYKDILYFPSKFAACGSPWGSDPVCYPILTPLEKFIDQFITKGQMYPGMSSGPVVDLNTSLIVAVNTGVTETGIIISPLIGLFESIGR